MIEVIAYVADQSRAVELQMSLASWTRFFTVPVKVIDLGLSEEVRASLHRLHSDIEFLKPSPIPELSLQHPHAQRLRALYQKTILGHLLQVEKLVCLDADIVITSPRFRDIFSQIRPGAVLISPSAWDRDLHWKYNLRCLDHLRQHTRMPDLTLDTPTYNAGVWGMAPPTMALVSEVWCEAFRKAIGDLTLQQMLNKGSMIGDQEYLSITIAKLSLGPDRLHGSFNMQVHDNRMPWSVEDGEIVGGHLDEPLLPIKAIHYNNGRDVSVPAKQIRSPEVRAWIHSQYENILAILRASGIAVNVKNNLL